MSKGSVRWLVGWFVCLFVCVYGPWRGQEWLPQVVYMPVRVCEGSICLIP